MTTEVLSGESSPLAAPRRRAAWEDAEGEGDDDDQHDPSSIISPPAARARIRIARESDPAPSAVLEA
jgi:hypothetical protein